jgi:hypothetical protein
MSKIIYRGAINSLSFGNVSYNLLREFYKQNIDVVFFPFSEKLEFEAFDKINSDFRKWLIDSANQRFIHVEKDLPCLSQWHINGSESRIGKNQNLFSFYEATEPSSIEQSIVNLQDSCTFASSHAADCFKQSGCNNVHFVPIGFDTDFEVTDEEYLPNKIHFGLMGKFERRKNTSQIIKNWAKKYGNNYNYQLSCCVSNPFFKPEDMQVLLTESLGGQSYGNINILPHLSTNSEVNEFMNAIDIDLTGLSGAEGWNLPSFNSTALGKWSIVMNHTSHKDWANKDNSILVEPEQEVPIYDNTFFIEGSGFNQGKMHAISDDLMISMFEQSEEFAKKENTEGKKLQEQFTYKKTIDKLLDIINYER